MLYVALLRGINVGGSNRVDMKQLKAVFENAAMTDVRTYINSGNVIFSSKRRSRLPELLEPPMAEHFGFPIKVLVRDLDAMRSIVRAIPSRWTNDRTMRCNVMFLWDDVDQPSVLDELKYRQEIDDVRYTPGAVIWRVDAENIRRSAMTRTIGTPLYKRMTIRNCNTMRKLLDLMEEQSIAGRR